MSRQLIRVVHLEPNPENSLLNNKRHNYTKDLMVSYMTQGYSIEDVYNKIDSDYCDWFYEQPYTKNFSRIIEKYIKIEIETIYRKLYTKIYL